MFLACAGSGTREADYTSCYYNWTLKQAALPRFYVDILNFASEKKSRIDIYIDVPYNSMNFVKEADLFVAHYTTLITIVNEQDSTVESKEISRKLSLSEEEKNIAGGHDMTLRSFYLSPGTYTVTLKFTDENSLQSRTKKRAVTVRDFASRPLEVSDIMLIRDIREEKKQKVITPMVDENISGLGEHFNTFCEIYSPAIPETLLVKYLLTNFKYNNDVVVENPYLYTLQKPYLPTYQAEIPYTVVAESVTVAMDSIIVTSGAVNQLFLTFPTPLRHGNYRLDIEIHSNHFGKDTLRTSTSFTLHGVGFPAVLDVDDKIETFIYVAQSGEMKRLLEPASKIEKQKLLNEMWKEAGSWKMKEYYSRVEYANELFTCNVEGWKTPMGMVYIVLGEPDYIECNPGFERTETWYYPYSMFFTFASRGEYQDGTRYYWLAKFPELDAYRYWINAAGRWRR